MLSRGKNHTRYKILIDVRIVSVEWVTYRREVSKGIVGKIQ